MARFTTHDIAVCEVGVDTYATIVCDAVVVNNKAGNNTWAYTHYVYNLEDGVCHMAQLPGQIVGFLPALFTTTARAIGNRVLSGTLDTTLLLPAPALDEACSPTGYASAATPNVTAVCDAAGVSQKRQHQAIAHLHKAGVPLGLMAPLLPDAMFSALCALQGTSPAAVTPLAIAEVDTTTPIISAAASASAEPTYPITQQEVPAGLVAGTAAQAVSLTAMIPTLTPATLPQDIAAIAATVNVDFAPVPEPPAAPVSTLVKLDDFIPASQGLESSHHFLSTTGKLPNPHVPTEYAMVAGQSYWAIVADATGIAATAYMPAEAYINLYNAAQGDIRNVQVAPPPPMLQPLPPPVAIAPPAVQQPAGFVPYQLYQP